MGQTLFISILVGIVLGVGAVIVAEYLDQAIQTPEEIMDLLEVPVLGSIATIVTEGDLTERKRRRSAAGLKEHSGWLRATLVDPVWRRVDQWLVRWGL